VIDEPNGFLTVLPKIKASSIRFPARVFVYGLFLVTYGGYGRTELAFLFPKDNFTRPDGEGGDAKNL
jgi:hypothetical protein